MLPEFLEFFFFAPPFSLPDQTVMHVGAAFREGFTREHSPLLFHGRAYIAGSRF